MRDDEEALIGVSPRQVRVDYVVVNRARLARLLRFTMNGASDVADPEAAHNDALDLLRECE